MILSLELGVFGVIITRVLLRTESECHVPQWFEGGPKIEPLPAALAQLVEKAECPGFESHQGQLFFSLCPGCS